ncbi:MAG: hypothetical protein ACR2H1_14235, partial [Limisphaerales bacterium]
NTTNHPIGSLLPRVPNFSNFYSYNGSGFTIATFAFGAWDQPNLPLAPGGGGFINTDTAFTNTFVGEVLQGSLTNPIPAGFSIRSSQVPQSGDVTTLGLTPTLSNFDNIYKYNGTGYTIYTLTFGSWSPSTPVIDIAESVFINAQAPTSWNRTFSVNN